MTQVEFLKARVAEDRAAALAGIDGQEDPEHGWGYEGRALTPHVGIIHHTVQAEHILRWHPYRVLAQCDAVEQIIKFHESWPVLVTTEPPTSPMIKALVQVYADHRDFDPAWSTAPLVHFNGGVSMLTPCGKPLIRNSMNRSRDLDVVTCPDCLRERPPGF